MVLLISSVAGLLYGGRGLRDVLSQQPVRGRDDGRPKSHVPGGGEAATMRMLPPVELYRQVSHIAPASKPTKNPITCTAPNSKL